MKKFDLMTVEEIYLILSENKWTYKISQQNVQ